GVQTCALPIYGGEEPVASRRVVEGQLRVEVADRRQEDAALGGVALDVDGDGRSDVEALGVGQRAVSGGDAHVAQPHGRGARDLNRRDQRRGAGHAYVAHRDAVTDADGGALVPLGGEV